MKYPGYAEAVDSVMKMNRQGLYSILDSLEGRDQTMTDRMPLEVLRSHALKQLSNEWEAPKGWNTHWNKWE